MLQQQQMDQKMGPQKSSPRVIIKNATSQLQLRLMPIMMSEKC